MGFLNDLLIRVLPWRYKINIVMEVRVLFFGVLAEEAAADEITLEAADDLQATEELILKKYPGFKKYSYRLSVNKVIVKGNERLKDGDEIALMPPFAGG